MLSQLRSTKTQGVKSAIRIRPRPKDEVFKEPQKEVADFAFGAKVASVFDDMLLRSVPFYEEFQRMIAELSAEFAVDGTNVYDRGGSTGTTGLHLSSHLPQRVKSVGVDSSKEILGNRDLLTRSGFRCCDALLKHYNFSGLIAGN